MNSLSELGPSAGVGALTAYEELVELTAGCPLISGVEETLETEAVCPDCGLSLDQAAPTQRVDEALSHIDRACHRQMARLSSSAVQQVLRNSNDARMDQFLKVVQASQLSSLSDILDDDLIGYLRRFLVEGRVETALRPIFDQLQEGVTPKVDEAKTAMREVSQLLQRAFQAAQRALPPAETTIDSPPPRRERKRMEEELQKTREELEGKVERQILRRNQYRLTLRELTVLHLVGAGRSDKEIGLELGISPLTASKHVSNIFAKMNVASRTEASVRAVKEGLLE
jgi:DNA-binding CsgD family transcriptional regulator